MSTNDSDEVKDGLGCVLQAIAFAIVVATVIGAGLVLDRYTGKNANEPTTHKSP